MDAKFFVDGMIMFLSLIVLLTFHEFGHAWMASRCGDDTARLQGRVSLNPLVHIDLIGTVILPLIMIFASPSIGQFLVGWAKPVPVNPANLRNGRMDDILVTLAGPWMNLLLAAILMALARIGVIANSENWVEFCVQTARLSLLLFYLNLLPIPPLDGSQVVRAALGISWEAYFKVARFGFIILILALQVPLIPRMMGQFSLGSLHILAGWFGIPL